METKQRLSKYREASGISQERAAEKLNVSRQTISRWENGVSIPSTENLAKLSELYNVPVDTLLRDLDEPFFVPEQTVSSKPLAEEPAKPARKKNLVLAGLAVILWIVVITGVLYVQGRNEPPVLNREMEVEVIDSSAAIYMPFIPTE